MQTIFLADQILGWTFLGLSQIGALLLLIAAAAVAALFSRRKHALTPEPPVSLLKPLKGATAGLRDALESFCRQDYRGPIQLVFGVQDSSDPAAAIVRELKRVHPELDIELVIDGRVHGTNRKISNLINMAGAAHHDVLVVSDADIVVGPDYVRTVAAALHEPGVGVVTTPYVGKSHGDLWSDLAAMSINYQFLPNAVLGKALGLAHPCFGATLAVRASVLQRAGGFAALADHLADDYEMGRAVRKLGLRVAMPPITVEHICDEPGAGELVLHSLRWNRTIRRIDPAGYAGSLVTYPLPLALIAAWLLGPTSLMLAIVGATLASRIAFKLCIDAVTRRAAGRWWLTPINDILAFGLFIAGFGANSVDWQGARFHVNREGILLHP